MLDAASLDALETPLREVPLFPCEPAGRPPEDRKTWPEEYRQRSFIAYLRKHAAAVMAFSVANERKTGLNYGRKLKAMGLTPGVPDVVCLWDGGWAFCEFKGFRKDGRPGEMTDAQIAACNRIHRNGHPVGCFFTATAALDFLRRAGAPLS